jgi:hypothetical protein
MYRLTEHMECVTFTLIYYYHYMFRPLFRSSSGDYNQMLFWAASQFTYMGLYLRVQCQYLQYINSILMWMLHTPCVALDGAINIIEQFENTQQDALYKDCLYLFLSHSMQLLFHSCYILHFQFMATFDKITIFSFKSATLIVPSKQTNTQFIIEFPLSLQPVSILNVWWWLQDDVTYIEHETVYNYRWIVSWKPHRYHTSYLVFRWPLTTVLKIWKKNG